MSRISNLFAPFLIASSAFVFASPVLAKESCFSDLNGGKTSVGIYSFSNTPFLSHETTSKIAPFIRFSQGGLEITLEWGTTNVVNRQWNTSDTNDDFDVVVSVSEGVGDLFRTVYTESNTHTVQVGSDGVYKAYDFQNKGGYTLLDPRDKIQRVSTRFSETQSAGGSTLADVFQGWLQNGNVFELAFGVQKTANRIGNATYTKVLNLSISRKELEEAADALAIIEAQKSKGDCSPI